MMVGAGLPRRGFSESGYHNVQPRFLHRTKNVPFVRTSIFDSLKATKGRPLQEQSDGLALTPGDRAPDFTLVDQSGEPWDLNTCEGHLVLFFFPRADTPACTSEAQDFSRMASAFGEIGTAPIGISADPPRKLARFRDKAGLLIPLLSDESGETLRAYGAWGEKRLYGRSYQGILRSTFLIDSDRHVRAIWRNVKVPGHAAKVLEAAAAIG
jgi:peroxiredoxin Q/BCP